MSDHEETAFFWESKTWTPAKGKKQKSSRKDKIQLKHKPKTDKKKQKKKKNKSSKFVEALDGRREEKKEKKKKKGLALELDERFTFSGRASVHAKPPENICIFDPQCSNTHKHDKDCKKKIKRKKKVAFDSSPGYFCAKRPKIVDSPLHSRKESFVFDKKAVRHNEICLHVTGTRFNQAQTHVDESQCITEDINSQDLFITQKTFRALSSEPSSGEASDKAVNSSPQIFTPHSSVVWFKQHLEGSYKCPQNSHFQHHKTINEHTQKHKTVYVLLSEEEEERELVNKAHQNPKKVSFQTHSDANLTATVMPVMVKEYQSEPLNLSSSLDFAKSMKNDHVLSEQSPSCLSVVSTSTQTENFFTSELCSYHNFCRRSRVNVHPEDFKPLDLSLPQRTRRELGTCLSVEKSSPRDNTGTNHKEPNLNPYCYSDMKDTKAESDSDVYNIAEMTSGEDEPRPCTVKLGRTQVRAVQMRLNESFFFKTKGLGESYRPESPLMKLNQSREVKSRKVI